MSRNKTRALLKPLLRWYAAHARDLPWRKTRDPYAVWVSEIMLQQTQVKTVLGYWERWMHSLPDIRSLATAPPEKIHKLWEGLGYYTRVRNLQKAAQIILRKHSGQFPEDFAEVLELPGIGRYTAGAICSIAFNQPTPILDGNVMRVLARVFAIGGDPRDRTTNAQLWNLADELVSQASGMIRHKPLASAKRLAKKRSGGGDSGPGACSRLNQALMEIGALICTPKQPRCCQCPVASHCLALQQGRVNELPQRRAGPRATPRRFAAFVTRHQGKVFVRQRPAGIVNAHLWEFPNVEVQLGDKDVRQAARKLLGSNGGKLEPLCQIRHSITRYRISLEVFGITGPTRVIRSNGKWLAPAALARLPFCSAHKKILQRL
jgi:A/G-specific adenine glycosylase